MKQRPGVIGKSPFKPVIAVILFLPGLLIGDLAQAKQTNTHPRLIMTASEVAYIRQNVSKAPLFQASLSAAQHEVDQAISEGIDVPIPSDYSGGYTHEQHKRNYAIAAKAGALYLVSGDEQYASFVRDMLLQYAQLYENLPLHPKTRSYARGKLFWQCLNDANWLVFMSQAYDAIYEYVSQDERSTLENKLFRPFADHISANSPQFFNRIHNHSTWGTAAVGMIGLVLGDEELVNRALYGLDVDNFSDARDDDGGFIRTEGQQAGFLANLDNAFSPDGYYTEGPYYQRYAMYPFLVFAQSLRNTRHTVQAFERNNGVLLKAVNALIQLSDNRGDFFPLNDAQKGMSLLANELVTAVDVTYQVNQDPSLLSIAAQQNRVLLDSAGFSTALALAQGNAVPFKKRSIHLRDGKAGDEGGLAILRSEDNKLTALFKFTSQGLSHGHYDKLSFSLYDQASEVLQDYGMVRFVNLEAKGGGNYLPENATWAKQSIAHNTLTIDETSHFGGEYEVGSQHHAEFEFFDAGTREFQIVQASESKAYPGTHMRRTLAMVDLPKLPSPFLIDVLQVQSEQHQQYDLPFHYFGQIVSTSMPLTIEQPPKQLGAKAGYQHLALEASGQPNQSNAKITWLNNRRIYSLTTVSDEGDQTLLTRLGLNDPNFNLRRDPSIVLRRNAASSSFATVIEPHGRYNPVTESATSPVSQIENMRLEFNSQEYLALSFDMVSRNETATLILASNNEAEEHHKLRLQNEDLKWQGPYHWVIRSREPRND